MGAQLIAPAKSSRLASIRKRLTDARLHPCRSGARRATRGSSFPVANIRGSDVLAYKPTTWSDQICANILLVRNTTADARLRDWLPDKRVAVKISGFVPTRLGIVTLTDMWARVGKGVKYVMHASMLWACK